MNWKQEGFVEDKTVSWAPALYTMDGRSIAPFLGSSPEVLRELLLNKDYARPTGPYCYYLDSHWGNYWPLLDELKVIADSGTRDSVIIIHDFKVPGKPWGYDNHGGVDLDINYVRESLLKINPNYKIFYNEEAEGNCRGICYCCP